MSASKAPLCSASAAAFFTIKLSNGWFLAAFFSLALLNWPIAVLIIFTSSSSKFIGCPLNWPRWTLAVNLGSANNLVISRAPFFSKKVKILSLPPISLSSNFLKTLYKISLSNCSSKPVNRFLNLLIAFLTCVKLAPSPIILLTGSLNSFLTVVSDGLYLVAASRKFSNPSIALDTTFESIVPFGLLIFQKTSEFLYESTIFKASSLYFAIVKLIALPMDSATTSSGNWVVSSIFVKFLKISSTAL